MNNSNFTLFSFVNSKTKSVQDINVRPNASWNSLKTGDKMMDSIFAKADLNGDGIAQPNELNSLNKLLAHADSQFGKTANNGILEKEEMSFLEKFFKKGDKKIMDVPEQEPRVQNNSKPWSEGLNRNIKTISLSQRARETIANFDVVERELNEIGQKEGFSITKDSYGAEPWAEDAKINRADGKTYVQYYNSYDLDTKSDAVDSLAKSRKGFNVRQGKVAKSGSNFEVNLDNKDKHIGTSYLEGGNVLQTLKADGSAGAIIGDMSVVYTMSVMNLENTPENELKAKQAIAEDLGINIENLTVIPQYDFHVDMCYRPLNDGEVAVPDYDEGIKVLQNIINDSKTSKGDKLIYQRMLDSLITRKNDAKGAELRSGAEKSLQQAGYKLVRIPDFGDYNINYMNAVGGTSNKDGEKFLITNKSNYPVLDKAVEQYYNQAGVSRVYFVSTQGALDKMGGIDCLTSETMY